MRILVRRTLVVERVYNIVGVDDVGEAKDRALELDKQAGVLDGDLSQLQRQLLVERRRRDPQGRR